MNYILLLLFLINATLATKSSTHTNNWALLVDTSRFWFNYRHSGNVLAVYRMIKELGIPDTNIILMIADDHACSPRNMRPGHVFYNADRSTNVYGESVEVDYRGYEVTVESMIRVLTGRHEANVPRSKRLLTDEHSNVFVYMSGHGGEEFIKFQDAEEISSSDLADAFEQMHEKRRYNELFFMADTCQASSLHKRFYSPNILSVGSSLTGENAYSHHNDRELGVAVVDRFTFYLMRYFETMRSKANFGTLQDFASQLSPQQLHSTPGWRTDLFNRTLADVQFTDFFGAVTHVDAKDIQTNPLQESKRVVVEEKREKEQQQTVFEKNEKSRNYQNFSEPTIALTVLIVLSTIIAKFE